MKIFDTKNIRLIDEYTIRHEPVSSVDLMERAARGFAGRIMNKFSPDVRVKIFTGPGNNGGDGWAIARLLAEKGFLVQLYHLNISLNVSPDSVVNRERLVKQSCAEIYYMESPGDFPGFEKTDLIIDALFGSGLTRPLEGLALQLVKHINKSGCRIISVDIPSGLFGEDNRGNNPEGIIQANHTLTFQFPKRAFFFFENEKFTGQWQIVPIGLHRDIISETDTHFFYADAEEIGSMVRPRMKFSHKGAYGHALLISGSYGMMGAAILAARACLRTGAGLITTHVPSSGYPVIQSAVPESIFSIDPDDNVFSQCPDLDKYTAIAAGPGIGKESITANALENLLKRTKKPLLLDADALNILAGNIHLLEVIPKGTVITPHPGEFDRLAGKSETGYDRNQKQISLSIKYGIIIVLKGAYTSVTMPDGKCYYNSTGNPGMATGGSGDVLTGMILALLAQGYKPDEAALTGVYIHGLAGDLALAVNSQESMIASDIVENIGNAFKKIQEYEKTGL